MNRHEGYVWIDNAMDLWCLTRPEVLVACWYAGAGNVVRLHGKGGKYVARRGPWRKRWGAWAAESHQALWNHRYDDVTDPPTRPRPSVAADHTTATNEEKRP